MNRSTGFTLVLTAFALCYNIAVGQTIPTDSQAVMPQKYASVLRQYCYDCHDAESREGKLNMEELSFTISRDISTAEWWAKILNAINSGEMPPMDADPIADADKLTFLEDLSQQMVVARNILSDSGGVVVIRRLNRREYQNTLESLLGFRPDVSTLPADDGTGGFDTSGASLFFSSDQFEQYRATATRALQAVLTPRRKPKSTLRRFEPEEKISEPFFQLAEDAVGRLKQAKAYLAQREKPPTDFGFRDHAHAEKQAQRLPASIKEFEDYIGRLEAKTGAVLIHRKGGTPAIPVPKVYSSGGRYVIRVRAGYYEGSPERERYLQYDFSAGTLKNSTAVGQVKVTGTIDQPAILEIPVEQAPGNPGTYVIRQRDYKDKASRYKVDQAWKTRNGLGQPPSIWVDWVEIEGPFFEEWPNPVQAELIPPQKQGESEAVYARRIIKRFATKAFREHTPNPEFIDKLVARFVSKSNSGNNSLGAAIDGFALVLSSPGFLYLSEPTARATGGNVDETEGPAASADGSRSKTLTDRELAVRLAYFLWSAPPDDQLLMLAKSGTLSKPDVLQQQTARLLIDRRSNAFISSFAHQWLDMTRLDQFEFDAAIHPEFDEAVRQAARGEVYETIRHIIDEELPLQTLLKADFVIANDVLADFYGLEDVTGDEFRKVPVPAGSPRGGLLGAAATHIMGSDGTRSSPVERGAWVLRHLVNAPPPPAPANVPMLSRFAGEALGARDLQKAHQEEPQCAQCHRKIDPIGYGLENFTAAGLWRDKEKRVLEPVDVKNKRKAKPIVHLLPIDSSGTLPRGEQFRNYFELRDAVSTYGEAFADGFTEHLIAYALGRPYSISDDNLAAEITSMAKQDENTIAAFIHALVQSQQFRGK